MIKKILRMLSILFVLTVLLVACQQETPQKAADTATATPAPAAAEQAEQATPAPVATPTVMAAAEDLGPNQPADQRKFRIGVVMSGEWWGYPENFLGILNAFKELGWMKEVTLSEEAKKSILGILQALQTQDYSDYLEFPLDMYFSFDWKRDRASEPAFQKIIAPEAKLDVIISLGTDSSIVITTPATFHTPVVVTAVSDPVRSGIITSVEDSGKDYLTAFCDPNRFIRQVRLFHELVNFKKLGILYADTLNGQTYAALEDIKTVAAEKGFEIVTNTNVIEETVPEALPRYEESLKELAPKVDAMYLTIQAGLRYTNLPRIMETINSYKLPTFAMEGSGYVKRGVLFSISAYQMLDVGRFNAKNIIRILKGARPRDLEQIFSITPAIAVNFKEAELIGYDVPVDVLGSADEVYNDIFIDPPEAK